MQKKILTFNAPDRAGKSTLIKEIESLGKGVKVIHLGPPQGDWDNPLEDIERHIEELLEQTEYNTLVYDRGWICRHVYSQIRDKGFDMLNAIKYLELHILRKKIECYHVILYRPWYFSGPKNFEEVETTSTTHWETLYKMESRRKEHLAYYDFAYEFLTEHSLFPTIELKGHQRFDVNDVLKGMWTYKEEMA